MSRICPVFPRKEEGGMSGVLYADFAGMDGDRAVLTQIGSSVGATGIPARTAADDAVAAAGEFSGDLDDGAATFGLSWWSALSFFGECADLLADNLGSAVLVLSDVDTALGGSLQPGSADTGGPPAGGPPAGGPPAGGPLAGPAGGRPR
jgi:hypothetical protein